MLYGSLDYFSSNNHLGMGSYMKIILLIGLWFEQSSLFTKCSWLRIILGFLTMILGGIFLFSIVVAVTITHTIVVPLFFIYVIWFSCIAACFFLRWLFGILVGLEE